MALGLRTQINDAAVGIPQAFWVVPQSALTHLKAESSLVIPSARASKDVG